MDVWEEHDLLFHYTTQSGLKGILETQTLHATHFGFMNDSSEMFHMKPKLVQMFLKITMREYERLAGASPQIRDRIDAVGGTTDVAQHDASKIVDSIYRITFGLNSKPKFYQPFVVSFCGHKDDYERKNGQLSLWRAYGKDSGYALVFSTKALVELLKREGDRYFYDFWGAGDIIYDGDDNVFKEEFKNLIDAVNVDGPKLLRGDGGPYTALNNAFIRSVPRYKHRGFLEEKEVRIVVSPADDSGIEMLKASGKFAQHKHKEKKIVRFKETLAPYIVLFEDLDVKLPIERIIVGPHADKVMRRDKLQQYLELSGLEIDVSCSGTPLV